MLSIASHNKCMHRPVVRSHAVSVRSSFAVPFSRMMIFRVHGHWLVLNIQLPLPANENFQDPDHRGPHRQCVSLSTQARPHRVSRVDSPLTRRHANAGKGRRAPILRHQLNADPNRCVHHRTSEDSHLANSDNGQARRRYYDTCNVPRAGIGADDCSMPFFDSHPCLNRRW